MVRPGSLPLLCVFLLSTAAIFKRERERERERKRGREREKEKVVALDSPEKD